MFPQECSYIYPQPSASGKYNYIPSGNISIFTLRSQLCIFHIYNFQWVYIYGFPAEQGTYADMYPWVHIEPFKNDKYDIHNQLLRKICICSLRNVVIFTLSLRLRVNITTFLRGTYTYLPFGASYVYSILLGVGGVEVC